MTKALTAGEAASDFISFLSDARRAELRDVVLMSQSAEHWHWYQEVIDRYGLADANSFLVRDINERFDDPEGAASLLFSRNGEPILEADRLLRLTQALLRRPLQP